MVYLITGPKNAGKTTKLLNLYKEKKGGGIASIKGNKDGYRYYNMVFLGSALSPLLLATEDPSALNEKGFFKFKRFYFNQSAFKNAYIYITQLIALRISPIFLDEVGELELNGNGFHKTCLKLINLRTDVYITVRDRNVGGFLKMFKPKDFKVLKIKE